MSRRTLADASKSALVRPPERKRGVQLAGNEQRRRWQRRWTTAKQFQTALKYASRGDSRPTDVVRADS